jgi:hypothetical protein
MAWNGTFSILAFFDFGVATSTIVQLDILESRIVVHTTKVT